MKARLLSVAALAIFIMIILSAAIGKSQILSNQSPVASFAYSPNAPMPGEPVVFDASSSYDPDGRITTFAWDFGDGTTAIVTTPTVSHVFLIDGAYTVELTVVDNGGASDSAAAVVQVSTVVFFRVVISGTTIPLANAKVTAYYKNGGTWTTIPPGPSSMTIKYDNMTQPHLSSTDQEKYRNPGYTASILRSDASNIGFDIYPGCWSVYFKIEWGSYVAYWPNETTRVFSYKNGAVEQHSYSSGHRATWDSSASTYVIKVNDIPNNGVSPTESHPIIVGILCPPPPVQYYLTVNTNPTGITTIPGQGWYTSGTNVPLTAPDYANVTSNSRYRFSYWDVDGVSKGAGVNPITVAMLANHTATAHYVLQYAVVFNQNGLASDATGTTLSVNGTAKVFGDMPFTYWVDVGNSVVYSYSSTVASSVPGKQYRLNSVTGSSSPIVVTGSTTVCGNYVVQYSITFAQTGLDTTATGTVVTANSVSKTYPQLPYTFWVDSGTVVTYSYSSTVTSSTTGKQFRLASVSGSTSPITITSSVTVTGNYVIQYQATFTQTGLDSTASGTIVTVNGTPKIFSTLPYTLWVDNGGSITYSYSTTIASSISGKQFLLTSITGSTSPITITSPTSVTGNYKTQYYLTVSSPYDSPTPVSGWFDSGSSITDSVTTPTNGPTNTRYVCLGWTGTGNVPPTGSSSSVTFTITQPSTITWNWKTQYYFTVNSILDSPSPSSGWFDSGSSITESVTSPVSGGSGIQYVCTGWIGSGSVPTSGSSSSFTFTITQASFVTWNWKTQYYLTVSSPYDSPTPVSGWFDSGSSITDSVTSPVSGGAGKQYVCTGWTGTGSIPSSGTGTSVSFAISQVSRIVWNWKTQYQVTFSQSGVGSDFLGTVVTVDSVNYGVSSLSFSAWYDSGSSHTFSFASPLTVGSKQYVWSSTSGLSTLQSGTLTATASGSVVGNYIVQNQITFDEVGVNSDFTGTVVTIDSVAYTRSQLPVSFSWNVGSTHNFAFQSPLVVGSTSTQYVWTNTTGLSSLQSGSITITSYGSIIGNYKTQYYLTVSSPYDSPAPVSGWFDSGSSITESVTSPVSGGSGKQYVCTGWTGTGSVPSSGSSPSVTFTITTASSITWTWKTQYYLTVSSPYGSPTPASGWFDSGSSIIESVTSPVSGPSGTQYVVTGWTGTGNVPGSGSGSSVTFTITTASSITWTWKTQYYLTVSSPYDSPTPVSGWFDSGSSITESVTSPVSGGSGKQYVCTGWTGTGSVPSSGSSPSVTFTITTASSITWTWKTQYQVTFGQTGLDPSALGTVVTVNAVPINYGQLPYAIWVDSGNSVTYAYNNLSSSNTGQQFILLGVTGSPSPATVTNPMTITGNYKTQYQVTFNQSGVGPDFTGTLVTIDSSPYTASLLPASFWWDNGSSHTFSFASPLVVNASRQYNWVSTTGLTALQSGALTITGSGSVTGNYATETKLQVTFTQTGLTSDFTGTVVTIDGTNYGVADLAVSFWWATGSVHTFSYQSPLLVTPSVKQYVWTSTSGLTTSQTGSITVTTSGTVTATYGTQYYLALITDPPGIATPTGAGWYNSDTNVTINTPGYVDITPGSSRYRFNGWTTTNISKIADPSRTPTTTIVNEDPTITANYVAQYMVTVNQTGVGPDFTGTILTVDTIDFNGTSLPVTFAWDNGTTHNFEFHSPLLVTPNAKQYTWTGTTGLSTSQIDTITATTFGIITGSYNVQYYVIVGTNPPGIATIPGQGWYDQSTIVTLTAPAVPNYVFDRWYINGAPQGAGTNPIAVTMNAPYTTQAYYNPSTPYMLTITTTPGGTTNPAPASYNYSSGQAVQVTAIPNSGYILDHWEYDGTNVSASNNPYTVTMNTNHNLKAVFTTAPQPPAVTITPMTQTISPGQSVPFTSSVTGGKSPFQYQWFLDGSPVGGATANTWTFTSSATGIHFVHLKVTDALNNTAFSAYAQITIIGQTPVGGYSVSLSKQKAPITMAAYITVLGILSAVLVSRKRKRK